MASLVLRTNEKGINDKFFDLKKTGEVTQDDRDDGMYVGIEHKVNGLISPAQAANIFLKESNNLYNITKVFSEFANLLHAIYPAEALAKTADWFGKAISPVFAWSYFANALSTVVNMDVTKVSLPKAVKNVLELASATLTNWNLFAAAIDAPKKLTGRVLTVVNLGGDILEVGLQGEGIHKMGQRIDAAVYAEETVDAQQTRIFHFLKLAAAVAGVAAGVLTILGWFLGTLPLAPAIILLALGVGAAALKVTATLYEQTRVTPLLT